MTYSVILAEIRGRVGLVTLNRPEAMNAFNPTLTRELMDALEAFDNDDSVGAMVVSGNQKVFAAGADIKEMAEKTAQQMADGDFIANFDRIRAIRKPVIAAVSGWALGGGCEVALACDMIVASETAKFGQPEITIGVIPARAGPSACRARWARRSPWKWSSTTARSRRRKRLGSASSTASSRQRRTSTRR